jgi:hypothetical protein
MKKMEVAMSQSNHLHALITRAMNKARKHLSETPLIRHGSLRVRFLQLSGFYLLETHSTTTGTMLQILDTHGQAKLKLTYFPWRVIHFTSDDFGWLQSFLTIQNSCYIEVYNEVADSNLNG